MSLEGLRAWIGEVERKLGKRTRVFLALAVIAVGLGGAALYVAIDARENSVSEGDVQELQRELEARIDGGGASEPAPLPEPEEEEEPAPAPEPGTAPGTGSNSQGQRDDSAAAGEGTAGVSPDGSPSGAQEGTPESGGAPSGSDAAKLKELLEQTKKQNAEAEAEQAGK